MATSPTFPTTAAARAPDPRGERRFLLTGVSWSTYVSLRDALDAQQRGVRMTFLEGGLELMSPSELHEDAKKILARLLEIWAMEKDVDLRGFGNATFRDEPKGGGLEPDECYKIGPLDGGFPDLAIEVVVSAPDLDKLEVYRRLGVREVWIWQESGLAIHVLGSDGYEVRETSSVLPGLDVVLLASFVRPGESQTALARAYRDALLAVSLRR